jgi:hypothetical protein
MSDDRSPEDIFSQIEKGSSPNLPANRQTVTQSSKKVDEGVKTVEDKVIQWQQHINHWRLAITQNEQIIVVFCVLFGICYSYAINECTGNFHFPVYAYVTTIITIVSVSLLLIAPGELPLVTLVKFAVSIAFGHVAMMTLIAVDGHTWHWFTTDTCRYPITTDSIMVALVGAGAGYMFAKFEEIREGKRQ